MLHQQKVDFTEYEERVASAKARKDQAVAESVHEMASYWRDTECEALAELERYKEQVTNGELIEEPIVVGVEEEVERVVSLSSGIPVESLTKDDITVLSSLESNLLERVKGQNHVVEAVAKAIQRNKGGLRDKSKPIATFLFLGSSGRQNTPIQAIGKRTLWLGGGND